MAVDDGKGELKKILWAVEGSERTRERVVGMPVGDGGRQRPEGGGRCSYGVVNPPRIGVFWDEGGRRPGERKPPKTLDFLRVFGEKRMGWMTGFEPDAPSTKTL